MLDRITVVTGAFGVLGQAVAMEAAARGATVVALDLAAQAPPGLAERLLAKGLVLGGVDLTDAGSTASAFARVGARFGRIDLLVNVAGGFRWETVEGGSIATWDRLYALNLRTTVNASMAAIPHLLKGERGSIVNVGANGAQKAASGFGAYAASKAGVHRLTEALAEELKGRVTVNAVLPSIIDTPANRADMPQADFTKWVRPADLAALILFLASDEARAVTGALIPVTGGL